MKTCTRCSYAPIFADAPPTLAHCKNCIKEVLLSRIRTTLKRNGWYTRDIMLNGEDELAKHIIAEVKPHNQGLQVKVASGSSDSILHPLLENISSPHIPDKYLCEDLTPREVICLATLYTLTVSIPKTFWSEELDALEDNSPEVRFSLLAHFRDFLSNPNHGNRFTPPTALLPFLKL